MVAMSTLFTDLSLHFGLRLLPPCLVLETALRVSRCRVHVHFHAKDLSLSCQRFIIYPAKDPVKDLCYLEDAAYQRHTSEVIRAVCQLLVIVRSLPSIKCAW